MNSGAPEGQIDSVGQMQLLLTEHIRCHLWHRHFIMVIQDHKTLEVMTSTLSLETLIVFCH
jgi:hypothetical protein